MSPKYKLDPTDTQRAIDAFQLFINAYPESDKVAESNEKIDQLRYKLELKSFESGKLYYQTRNYSSAIQTLENMVKDYPGSKHTEEARYIVVKSSKDWADNSIYIRKEERFKKTKELGELFLRKHRASQWAEEVSAIVDRCQQELKNI